MTFYVFVSNKGGARWIEAFDQDDAARKYSETIVTEVEFPPDKDEVEITLVVGWQLPSGEVCATHYDVWFTRVLRWETKQPELPA